MGSFTLVTCVALSLGCVISQHHALGEGSHVYAWSKVPPPPYREKYFEQQVDHFNYLVQDTYQERYLISGILERHPADYDCCTFLRIIESAPPPYYSLEQLINIEFPC